MKPVLTPLRVVLPVVAGIALIAAGTFPGRR